MKHTCYLSLGSNLGDRVSHLRQAVDLLKQTGRITALSSLYRTGPVGLKDNGGDFLNMALCLETNLGPLEMLRRIKTFERKMGRPERVSGPVSRVIDIDILMVDDLVLSLPDLTVPHPGMLKRAFVLVPLCEIAPRLEHPTEGALIEELLEGLQSRESIDRYPEKIEI
jgi:2-amino-4-hydroxy-6-hydroxymethyldihydropteridine diphosphokinase